jgi:Zn-dependent protease
MNIDMILLFLPGFLIGLTVHEAAHAISAKWLGDRTAEKMGRISLNPMRHLSPMGTLMLLFVGFGWGKPVQVNIYNFKKPKFYYLLSSLAGPASNLLLAAVALGIMYLHPGSIITWICMSIYFVNVILAIVNLLPIPPLDGSKIWPCLIPGLQPAVSGKWSKIWTFVLVAMVLTGTTARIIGPAINFLLSLLPPAP